MSETTSKIAVETAVAGVPEAVPHGLPTMRGSLAWLRTSLFSSWFSTAITLVLAYLILRGFWGFVQWGLLNAVWWVPENQSQACRTLHGTGACWAVVTEKYRFILFATYPFDQQWRSALAIMMFVALYVVSAMRRFRRKELILIWLAALTPPSGSHSDFRWGSWWRSAGVRTCPPSRRSACSTSS